MASGCMDIHPKLRGLQGCGGTSQQLCWIAQKRLHGGRLHGHPPKIDRFTGLWKYIVAALLRFLGANLKPLIIIKNDLPQKRKVAWTPTQN
ncbi:hypothetical protein C3B51_13185 [Pseudoalteromonas rubra]|uniref:Uncharacterized protein n=1 Tax=Pseudoalteromonas rubra TaxID=43658 RepID=A0A4Q7EBS7_9GAMM|nr:hypothetical protein C3B51_13185 [Pseudoalteromonas rubra]